MEHSNRKTVLFIKLCSNIYVKFITVKVRVRVRVS